MTRIGVRAALVALLVVCALAAPALTPFAPDQTFETITDKYLAPSRAHPFGTDAISRDVYTRVLYGARITLLIAAGSVALSALLGTVYGCAAAFAGGRVDRAMSRVLDTLMSVPRILLLLAIAGFYDRVAPWALAVLLGVTGWYDVARLVRNETARVIAHDYVLAARATGVRSARIAARHVLPHLVPIIVVSTTIGVAYAITLQAGLTFLGVGVDPTQPSWGSMLKDGMSSIANDRWWLIAFPGLAAVTAVAAINALGDALREHFAPQQLPA